MVSDWIIVGQGTCVQYTIHSGGENLFWAPVVKWEIPYEKLTAAMHKTKRQDREAEGKRFIKEKEASERAQLFGSGHWRASACLWLSMHCLYLSGSCRRARGGPSPCLQLSTPKFRPSRRPCLRLGRRSWQLLGFLLAASGKASEEKWVATIDVMRTLGTSMQLTVSLVSGTCTKMTAFEGASYQQIMLYQPQLIHLTLKRNYHFWAVHVNYVPNQLSAPVLFPAFRMLQRIRGLCFRQPVLSISPALLGHFQIQRDKSMY